MLGKILTGMGIATGNPMASMFGTALKSSTPKRPKSTASAPTNHGNYDLGEEEDETEEKQ